LNFITRAQWGARPPKGNVGGFSQKLGFQLHHYASPRALADHAKCAGQVRAVQNVHMDVRGWSDIAYNFVVCNHGFVYEGRGWEKQNGATGNPTANDTRIAMCWAGHSDQDVFDIKAANAIHELASLGISKGWPAVVGGHKDFSQTSCPGNTLYAWMKAQTWGGTVGTPIMGSPQATAMQGLAFVKANAARLGGAKYPDTKLGEIVSAYWTVGAAEGVRPEVGLAQSCKETGFYTYTGDVKPDQNNFAGIGATGGIPGHSWPNVTSGVQGHLRRLRMYAAGPAALHDLSIMLRALPQTYWASAPNVEDLGGKWAPSTSYGTSVVNDYLKPLMQTQAQVPYADLVGHFSEVSSRKAILKGVMIGDGQSFFPDRQVTRGELSIVLDRLGLL
jgi:hypothetical protein